MKKIFCAIALAALIYLAYTVGYNSNNVTTSVLPASTVAKPVLSIYSLFNLTNEQRKLAGLAELSLDPRLNNSASDKCKDMVAKNYWAHNAPDGTKPWIFIGKYTKYNKAAENLAHGFYSNESIIDGWMNSPSHKENIVEPGYTNIGFAICDSPNFVNEGKQTIIVQHFSLPT